MKMRATWDALASDPDAYVGDPERGRSELQGMFERLGADPHGGTCIEVGCGSGRMSGYLARCGVEPYGIDLSAEMVRVARRDYPGIPFQVADLRSLRRRRARVTPRSARRIAKHPVVDPSHQFKEAQGS